jgi:PAS domain S-box-containing protein
MNSKLSQQLSKYLLDPQKLPQDLKAWNEFLQAISDTYENLEQEYNSKLQDNTALLGQKVIEMEMEKARDEAILEGVGEGMIVTDGQGKILVVNRGTEVMLGIIGDDLKNKIVFDMYDLYDKEGNIVPLISRPIYITLQTGKKAGGVFEFHHKNGMIFSLDISVNPVIQAGRTIGAVAILRDVTEQKAVDRMKTEFISLASHQLRTPLSAIRWFAEMLVAGDAGKLNPEQEDFAKNIYDSIERMTQLINSLLNIARVESGRIMIAPVPTDIRAMVEGIAKELEQSILQKELRFTINTTESLPKINIDPRLIRQVYFNLLTNAIKYTPKGGEVTVSFSQKWGNIISQIVDTGYGIPKNQQSHVFQKFFRGDNAARKETVGTGLGLYLTKAIVEASQGRIWFLSEENKGTIFWFTLPVAGTPAKKGDVSLD